MLSILKIKARGLIKRLGSEMQMDSGRIDFPIHGLLENRIFQDIMDSA
jgi:hypothetical protein